MKTHYIFHILVSFILIQFPGNRSLITAQVHAQDMVQEHIIKLEHNCTLAIDSRLDPKDTLTHEIEHEIRQVMSSIQALIPANDLTIYIVLCDTTNQGNIIPFMGIGGHPIGTDAVRMYIQPKNPNFKVKNVAWGLPHEIHHAIRMRKPNWHWSLLECIIMEGLADHFLVEVTGSKAGPWTRALSEDDIKKYLIKFKSHMHTTTESWDEFQEKHLTPWLFGRSGSDPIPSFTGYSLGWHIVENYINAHPKASGSSLLYVSAEVIAQSTPELKYEEQTEDIQITKVTSRINRKHPYGSFTDSRDGKTYITVQIGNQIWMAENLDYDIDDGSWLYDKNASNNASFGRLYDWKTAREACPDGWHLPSDEEWKQLEMVLDMSNADADTFGLRGENVGTKLKSTSGWNSGGKGTNESYFLALPSGYRFTNGNFYDKGYGAYFWTSTEYDSSQAWFRSLGYDGGDVGRNIGPMEYGFSIRCIKD